MVRLRRRDVRAIVFCLATILAVLAGCVLVLKSWPLAIVVTVAYAAWLLTRARMLRVYRRLRGEGSGSGWTNYYQE